MRICIIGGIFDKPAAYRGYHAISPETVLADGLRESGWEITVQSHAATPPFSGFDVVHVHHYGRAAFRLAAAAHRPPFVFTTHDPFAMNGLPVGWKRRFTDAYVLHKADVVVALSNAERDFLVRYRSVEPQRIAVIPNGISATFDRPEPPAEDTGDLLFVGQLRKFKGLDYLIAALPAIRARFPRAKLRVVYQTAALLERYQGQAARLGLQDAIEFAGPRTPAHLAQLYSSAAVVVSPSLGECLSTVVLEAMCCGAAVVATDVGGVREQLDPDTGIIVPPRDPVALAEAVCTLLADARLRRRLGDAARLKAHAQFSVPKMIDRHIRLYEEVTNSDARAA